MAIVTLREFLDDLEKKGQLLRIKDEVSLEPDLGAAARAINNVGKDTAPALLLKSCMATTTLALP
jgi:UbiD family decarboxylase